MEMMRAFGRQLARIGRRRPSETAVPAVGPRLVDVRDLEAGFLASFDDFEALMADGLCACLGSWAAGADLRELVEFLRGLQILSIAECWARCLGVRRRLPNPGCDYPSPPEVRQSWDATRRMHDTVKARIDTVPS